MPQGGCVRSVMPLIDCDSAVVAGVSAALRHPFRAAGQKWRTRHTDNGNTRTLHNGAERR
ncbi:hypothetical protein [Komagataeibacter xylinus]|uniref:hypothetical protein n=1 Tax=Komagataeibacter xylinus TaxID=28448 RepID=UPI001330602B|nr:hypothetical protein [Komagataeibacter xylinus]